MWLGLEYLTLRLHHAAYMSGIVRPSVYVAEFHVIENGCVRFIPRT